MLVFNYRKLYQLVLDRLRHYVLHRTSLVSHDGISNVLYTLYVEKPCIIN